jgi:23S rRNA (guanosine2251-2'-O)-methyltransferase
LIVYGRNPVREAERGPRRVLRKWEGLPDVELERICGSPDHQGICVKVEPYTYADPDALLVDEDALVLALDEVQDPQNLGAVIRVAEVAGVAGLVLPERRSAEVTSAVCKASAGAVEHLAIARVGNLANWIGEAKKVGAWVYGASTEGVAYDQPDYQGRVVLVLGAEDKGLRPRVAGSCDQLVALPVHGQVESLNVSAAAAALVYGILQFRVQS